MKILKKIFLKMLTFALLAFSFNTYTEFPDFDPNNVDELEKLAEELLAQLPPEEQEKVLKEAEEIARWIEEQPEDVQREITSEMQREVSELMGADSPIKDFLAKEKELPVIEDAPKKEEPKITATATELQKIKLLITNIVNNISDIIIKADVLPRVSENRSVETKWLELKSNLSDTKSLLNIINKKEKLLDALLSDESSVLRKNLEDLNKTLRQYNDRLDVPDTAGLRIVFEEEKPLEKTHEKSIKILENIVVELHEFIESKQISWGITKLVQKYAPEELKELKKEEVKKPATTGPAPIATSGIVPMTKKAAAPTYKRPSVEKRGADRFAAPRVTDTQRMPQPGLEAPKPEAPKGPGKPPMPRPIKPDDKDKDTDKDKDKKRRPSLPTDKPADEDKSKKDEKPKKSPLQEAADKHFGELEVIVNSLSDNIEENNLLDLLEVYKKDISILPQVTRINGQELLFILAEVSAFYDRAVRIVNKLEKTISKMSPEGQKHYRNKLKKLLEKEEIKINDFYDKVKELNTPETKKKIEEMAPETKKAAYEQLLTLLENQETINMFIKGEKKAKDETQTPATK